CGERVMAVARLAAWGLCGREGGQGFVPFGAMGCVRRGPGFAAHHFGKARINPPAVVGDGSVELCLCRHASQGGNAHVFTLAFIRYKPEGPVSLEGTAE